MSSRPHTIFPTPHLVVGQDRRGRWLVQDDAGLIEGAFTTRQTALSFARAESEIHHAPIEIRETPLTSHLFH